ncbi:MULTISPECIES: hypothetical protein [unclassified Shewanella]|uniref:hypothetical protein n=2 Tax=Shewanella TaxID=22 RepID=UPI0022BA4DCB|nr:MULTISPECIES: hypothetical protein [unclassified Shewanella]MEC4739072.1 hypothetical protein [Shewanella sp. E94]WBJ95928.1 hypothetical protein HWQ47_01980 [Shewanella sp. MTB7]
MMSGKVADGYLVGAKVCLDLNQNKLCDEGEPSATSTAGGDFSITDATQEQIENFPLLVEVTAGVVDEDTGEAITQPYTMTAPVGYEFVSPLTTMVQNEVEQGNELADAEASLQGLLGTTLALSQDYVAQQLNAELEADVQEEYERLHHVAQVTAQLIANNFDAIQTAADDAGISADDIIGLIVDQIIEALDEIVSEVEFVNEQGGEFDPEDVLESDTVVDASTVSTEDLEGQVQIRNTEATAAAANLTELVSGDGINFFDDGYYDDMLALSYGTLTYGTLTYDAETQTSAEVRFKLLDGEFVTEEEMNDEDDLILTESGWVVSNDNFVIGDLNDDGSITLINSDLAVLSELIFAKQISVIDLKIKLFLSEQVDTDIWHKVIPETVTFSTGAEAFELSFSNINDVYSIFNWNGCHEDEMFEGMCNSVWAHTADSEMDGPVVTLSSLISTTASDGTVDNIIGPHVGWDGSRSIIAEMIDGGAANYYKIEWQAQSDSGEVSNVASLFATGTWRDVTVLDQRLLLLALPESVRDFGDSDDDDIGELLFTEFEGAVRRGEYTAAGQISDDDEWVFNLAAKNDILENLDLTLLDNVMPSEPEHNDFVCRDGDSDWDDETDQPKEGTTRSYSEYLALVANCRAGEPQLFNTEMLAGQKLKSFDSDGEIESILTFNVDDTGSHTDNDSDEPMVENYHWVVNDAGELILEVGNSTGTNDIRAVISLIKQDGDHFSIKGFVEDNDWSPMDGTAGEVWSDKMKLFPLPEPDNSDFVCHEGDSTWDDETDQPVAETLVSFSEY